jgi:hypothetical protein
LLKLALTAITVLSISLSATPCIAPKSSYITGAYLKQRGKRFQVFSGEQQAGILQAF